MNEFMMNYLESVNILGVEVSAVNATSAKRYLLDNLDAARGNYICAANAYTTVMAREDRRYQTVQNASFMTLPDGKPLSVIGKKRGMKTMGRVAGPDFLEDILAQTNGQNHRHYFYGTTQENLDRFIAVIQRKYSDLNIVGAEPSVFRPLSEVEEAALIDRIQKSQADFVWVALGAPRQEIFCHKLSTRTSAVWVAVGGAFHVISGVIPRAPQWMQNAGLEWFYRWTKEPGRLFWRYFRTNSKFLWYLISERR